MKEFLQRGCGIPGTALHLIRDNNPPRLAKKKKKHIYKFKKKFFRKSLRLNQPLLHRRQNKGVVSSDDLPDT